MYNQINDSVLEKLKEIVGEPNLLTAPEDLEDYSHDEVAELRAVPEAVASVSSAEQISRIMRLAQR